MATTKTTTTTTTTEKAKPVITLGWTAGTRYAAVSDKMQAGKLMTTLAKAAAEYRALRKYVDEAGYTKSDSDDTPAAINVLPATFELSARLMAAHKDDKKVVKACMSYRPATAKKDAEIVVRRDIVKLVIKVNSITCGMSLSEAGEIVTEAYKFSGDIAYAKGATELFSKWLVSLGLHNQKVAKAVLQLARKAVKAVNALRSDLERVNEDEGLASVEGFDIKVKPAQVKAVAAD